MAETYPQNMGQPGPGELPAWVPRSFHEARGTWGAGLATLLAALTLTACGPAPWSAAPAEPSLSLTRATLPAGTSSLLDTTRRSVQDPGQAPAWRAGLAADAGSPAVVPTSGRGAWTAQAGRGGTFSYLGAVPVRARLGRSVWVASSPFRLGSPHAAAPGDPPSASAAAWRAGLEAGPVGSASWRSQALVDGRGLDFDWPR